jgi:hypothetical protein
LSNNHLLDADTVKKAKGDEVYTIIIVHIIVAFRSFPNHQKTGFAVLMIL